MSETANVTAVHSKSRIVSEIPRHYLDLYPEYKELSPEEANKLQRKEEKELFGEYITPILKPEAAAPVEAPTQEGGK
jgi:hypothetical protein